jgi:hypothetical protein
VIIKVTAGERPSRPITCDPWTIQCETLGLDDEIWSIVEDCWQVDPEQRPTAKEVINRLSSRVGLPYPSENIIQYASTPALHPVDWLNFLCLPRRKSVREAVSARSLDRTNTTSRSSPTFPVRSVVSAANKQEESTKPSPKLSHWQTGLSITPAASSGKEGNIIYDHPPDQKDSDVTVSTMAAHKQSDMEDHQEDIVKHLHTICTDANPTELYRKLVKISQR